MNIEEARLYLEHTSKEDFNLEEWQKENRYQAIQVVLKEIERLNKRNKEIYEGFMTTTQELCEATKEIERLKEEIKGYEQERERVLNIIDERNHKAIDYMERYMFSQKENYDYIHLLDILKRG